MISLIKEINPTINFIFTVSPVRHIKDGFIENQQSKAHLITALHQVIKSHENSFYFPSYEIMMDELRDYRFYKEDMIHPNNIAVNYIWEKALQKSGFLMKHYKTTATNRENSKKLRP